MKRYRIFTSNRYRTLIPLLLVLAGFGVLVGIKHVTAAPDGPAGVSDGLQLWLSASEGVKAAGDVNATNGQGVAEWQDLSSAGRDATPETTEAIFSDTGLNYNPTLTFSEDNYRASSAGLVSGSGERSIFVVASSVSDGYRYVLGAGTFGGNNGFDFGIEFGTQAVFITTHNAQEAETSSWNPFGAARLAYGAVTGSTLYIAVNGGTPVPGGAGVNTVLDGNLNIGANSGEGEMWNGNISEVIYFDRLVTPTERQRINSYLALKYGFSLDQSTAQSYLASGSNLMWDKDASGAGTYDNGLFGIGRDDASGLSQIKSRGQTTTNVIILEANGEGTNTSPDFDDIDDLEFLVIGDNNGATSWTTTGAPSGYSVLSRSWAKQEQGDVGRVSLSFDVADPDFNIPVALGDGKYYFIYDTDNDGSLADETPQSLSDEGSNLWETTVDFGAGGLFTLATTSNPALNSTTPADNSSNVGLTSNLTMNFSRAVSGDTGDIVIRKSSDDSIFETIPANNAKVTGNGTTTITVNPTGSFMPTTGYYVTIDSDAFDDGSSNYFAGISNKQSWNFTTAALDNDSDGVNNETEDGGPNDGDGNGDGTPDSSQTFVTSLPNDIVGGGAYTTIEIDNEDCTEITDVSVVSKGSLGTDNQYDYPVGLIDFGVICSGSGDSTEVTIYYDKLYDTSNWMPRKYINGEFQDLSGAVFGTATVGDTDVSTIVYTLTDGGPLDADGVANGQIEDPAGPGQVLAADDGSLVDTGVSIALTLAFSGILIVAGFLFVSRREHNYEAVIISPDK